MKFMEKDRMKLSHLQSGPQLLIGDWAGSLSTGEKRVWAFQSSESRTLLEKINKLENGTMPLPDTYAKKSYKTGQDLTLKFYPERHKDYNGNRMKI